MEKEVSKSEFKKAYMKYRTDGDGWTDDYWQHFYENEEGKRYFLRIPESPQHNRLFIISDSNGHRMVFLTEEAEESFFDYHHRLFELQGDPQFMTAASFRQVGEELELDMEEFNACLEDGRYNNTIQQNVVAATAVEVDSTPSFFINGTLLRGNQPLTAFQQQINTIIGEAGASQ